MTTYLVTGGAGFIGSNFVHHLMFAEPDAQVVTLDKLTYAGNRDNLADLEGSPRHVFVRGDICDPRTVGRIFSDFAIDVVVNFAAETHVDRSIGAAGSFIRTDVHGTYVLLEAARKKPLRRFVQISTDEVYGSLEQGAATEDSPLMPRNPYSASKAGADRLAYSFWTTYGTPVIITRASNNYGPYQFPEKLMPLFITQAIAGQPLPLYGDGKNIRDWLHVEDHCAAVLMLAHRGENGQTYNIGGGNERTNLEITQRILALLGRSESLVRYVPDRPGHDRRYALDTTRLRGLGWVPRVSFEDGIQTTVQWYREHEGWWKKIKKRAAFRKYYAKQYNTL